VIIGYTEEVLVSEEVDSRTLMSGGRENRWEQTSYFPIREIVTLLLEVDSNRNVLVTTILQVTSSETFSDG
jgi:hypothetical protein